MTWTCNSCQWVNGSSLRCSRHSGQGKPAGHCRNCGTRKGARLCNVSFIVGEEEKKDFANIGPYRYRYNGQLVTPVQTHADGTAWG